MLLLKCMGTTNLLMFLLVFKNQPCTGFNPWVSVAGSSIFLTVYELKISHCSICCHWPSLLAPLDSIESAELIYWVYVGQMASVLVSSQQSAAISPTSGWGIVTKLSGYISGMVQLMPVPFFGQKIFGVKGHGPKRGKTVKIYLLLQFLSQDVHLFRMCCPPQGRKLYEPEF